MTLGSVVSINGFQPLNLPFLADWGIVGQVLNAIFNQNALVYGAFLLVPVAAFVLNKTTFGLKVRAAGQNPQAADTLGVNINQIRYITVTFGGVMAGIAGASLNVTVM